MQQLVFTQPSLFDFPSIKSIGTLRYCIRFAHLSNCEIYPLRLKTAFRCAPRYAIGTFVQFNKNSKVNISLNLWYHKRCLKYMLKLDLMLRWKVWSSIRIMMKYLCPSQPKILEPAYIVTKNWYELKWSWTANRTVVHSLGWLTEIEAMMISICNLAGGSVLNKTKPL